MVIKQAIQHLSKDDKLKPLTETVELDYHWKPEVQGAVYPYLLRSIVGQQVSIQAAAAIHKRFLGLFADQTPVATELLALEVEQLRAVGLSRQKVNYVRNVSEFFLAHQLIGTDWKVKSDEAIVQELTQIKGVGQWTVEVMLMFCLNRGDVFPVGDLGIQRTMERLYNLTSSGKTLRTEMTTIAEAWKPYRTLACYYLWSWKHRW